MPTRNRIKALRGLRDLTSEQLAERIGVSQSLMSRLESGKRQLTEDYIVRIANELRCTPNDILGYQQIQKNLSDEALTYAVSLALEVTRDLRSPHTTGVLPDAVRFVYNSLMHEGLLGKEEPGRTAHFVKALTKYLAPAPEQDNDAQ